MPTIPILSGFKGCLSPLQVVATAQRTNPRSAKLDGALPYGIAARSREVPSRIMRDKTTHPTFITEIGLFKHRFCEVRNVGY